MGRPTTAWRPRPRQATCCAAVESPLPQVVACCTAAAFQGLPRIKHRLLCLPVEETAKFFESQLGGHEKFCSPAKIPQKIEANLKRILRDSNID